MNKNTIKLSAIFAVLVLVLSASCTEDMSDASDLYDGPVPLKIVASISTTDKVLTRAAITEIEDKWSYTDFADNDIMGFYSSGGNWKVDNGKGDFNNLKLQYDAERNQFVDPEDGVNFSPTNMNESEIFMYYPYDANMNGTGMELRMTAEANKDGESDKILRCIDFLSSDKLSLDGVNLKNIALYGEFDHTFSELIIMRGKGFDSPPEGCERITAVLNKGYTNIKVTVDTEDTWRCTPGLFYNPQNTAGLSEEEARKWDAWKGGNYGITNQDQEGKEAWYIIVPTLGSQVGKKRAGERSMVDYIELYDNEGNLLQVKSLKLSGGNTKYVDAAWRYPMEITMEELVPTVNPFPIIPWYKDVDLTDERKRGINNRTDFEQWVRAYNTYLKEPNDANIEVLLKYGDTFVEEGNESSRTWHFYVLSDIDLSNYQSEDDAENNNVIISTLKDILDGKSTTFVNGKFVNHTIKGLSKTFIDNMENGSVQNLDFIEPKIIKDEGSTASAGIIANKMNGASIINCTIDNGTLFNPNGPAGMVAGSMNSGQVRNCTVSGFLTAKSTSTDNIIGEEPTGGATFADNNIDVTVTD